MNYDSSVEPDKKSTYAYVRVSTDRQRDKQTIKTQKHEIATYAAQQGYGSVQFIEDDGVSGMLELKGRPGGRRLLQAARSGQIERLILYKGDRISRATYINEAFAHEFWDMLQIPVEGVAEKIDLTTPEGRMCFTFSSMIGQAERQNTLRRSNDATERLAREGVWLGGIVPFGYTTVGTKKDCRLTPNDDPIPHLGMSEVEIVRIMFEKAGNEGISCRVLADWLNATGVPTHYVRDSRKSSNKRKTNISGIWRPSRVRGLLVNPTYKGLHVWGLRSDNKRKKKRKPIERQVPAIVPPELWERAQATLVKNRLVSKRNSKREYLLRGKMKCGLCGLTYIGTVMSREKVENLSRKWGDTYEVRDGMVYRPYYSCCGKQCYRGPYGREGKRCPSRSISSAVIEQAVWADVEDFLRRPGVVIEQLRQTASNQSEKIEGLKLEQLQIRRNRDSKENSKQRLLDLYKDDIIGKGELSEQLAKVRQECEAIEVQLQKINLRIQQLSRSNQSFEKAGNLLQELSARLDQPLDFATKRQLVDLLVKEGEVHSYRDEAGKHVAKVVVRYVFSPPDPDLPNDSGIPESALSEKLHPCDGASFLSLPNTSTETSKDVRVDSSATPAAPVYALRRKSVAI